MREISIDETDSNQRLDKFLLKYLNTAPKSFVYKMLRKKNIKLNDKKAQGSEILENGDTIKIFIMEENFQNFMEKKKTNQNAGTIDVLYEDENILVCNKPVGLLSHPENANERDTLIDRILLYLENKREFDTSAESVFTPALVNRLDRNTSGVVICGKNLAASQWLNHAMVEKKIEKYYKAMVVGEIKEAGQLAGYHLKNAENNIAIYKKTPIEGGKQVLTHYKPIKWGNGYTLLEVRLETGKTHQIRASFKEIGHPLIGDNKYGLKNTNDLFYNQFKLKSQFLHSEKIIFRNENGLLNYLNNKEIKACMPNIFQKIENKVFK